MSETAPLVQSELIQDQAKAEIMAYASSGQEELVVAERAKALDAASNIGNDQFRGEENYSAGYTAERHAKRAEEARITADAQALGAAAIYDMVKPL